MSSLFLGSYKIHPIPLGGFTINICDINISDYLYRMGMYILFIL